MTDRKLNYSALKLCAVLTAVYALQLISGFEPGYNAAQSEGWKFFTSFIGHSDAEHLFNNLFFIGLFGTIYELATNSKTFYKTFIISALGANLTAFIFYPNSFIIGASGGAMGLLSALTIFRPKQVGLAMGVPAPMYLVLPIYVLINFAGTTGQSTVAYEAHLFGIVTGTITGLYLKGEQETGQETESKVKDDNPEEDEKSALEDDKHTKKSWEEKIRRWEEKHMLD